jgi:hypothetical protein
MEPGRMTPISKWYGITYNWFRRKLKPNIIDIVKIASAGQMADFLTMFSRGKRGSSKRACPPTAD